MTFAPLSIATGIAAGLGRCGTSLRRGEGRGVRPRRLSLGLWVCHPITTHAPTQPTSTANQRVLRRLLWLAIVGAVVLGGCHPSHYRRQADRDADQLIKDKENDPRWALDRDEIKVDPRSRMFDPFDPDRPPLPPDDPESHKLMHRVDGKKGYQHWHDWGDTEDVQNPDWRAYLPLDETGVLVLDDRLSVKLALLHSPDYQRLLEQLYLSALDVSFERFRFDTQFFGGYAVDYAVEGPNNDANTSGQYRQVLAGTTSKGQLVSPDGITASNPVWQGKRAFTSGSQLVVDFANSLMWQFSGSGSEFATTTLLDFSLVQPLLRYAGRNRILERLTLAERTLLANVRQMERYRQGFYLQIMTGRDPGSGPSRRGGVSGQGLEGFSGIGASGFGGLAGGGTVGGGVISSGGTGAGQAGGFLGLLQAQQEILNQEDNLNDLRWSYLQLLFTLQELLRTKPYQNSDVVRQRLQVAQSKQAILNAESRLVNANANYQILLDRFKILLGLPPQICVKIDKGMLERVNLIDPAIRPIRKQLSELQTKVGDKILAILPQGDQPLMTWNAERAERLRELKELLNEVEPTRRQLMDGEAAQIRRVRADGLKLGGQLNDALKRAIERGAAESQAGDKAVSLRRDLDTLTRLRLAIERDDDWAPELRHWKQVQDGVANVERLQQQLAKGTDLDLSWMRTDANPATRELHQRYRDRVQTWNAAPLAQRPLLLQQWRARGDGGDATTAERISASAGRRRLARPVGSVAHGVGRKRSRGPDDGGGNPAISPAVRAVHRGAGRCAGAVQRLAGANARVPGSHRSAAARRPHADAPDADGSLSSGDLAGHSPATRRPGQPGLGTVAGAGARAHRDRGPGPG